MPLLARLCGVGSGSLSWLDDAGSDLQPCVQSLLLRVLPSLLLAPLLLLRLWRIRDRAALAEWSALAPRVGRRRA